jgi:hypothetical protein
MNTSLIINIVAFQAGWFACALGATHGLPWLGTLAVLLIAAWHLYTAAQPAREARLLAAVLLIGLVFDSLLCWQGLITFHNGQPLPPLSAHWMVALWVLFATALNVSMRWLRGRWWLAAAFGAVGGPMSYLAGAKLGALALSDSALTLPAIGVGWALLMPLLVALAIRFDGMTGADADSPLRVRHV